MKKVFRKIKNICNTIFTSIRVHFIRTKEYKKLIETNRKLEIKIHTIADESLQFFESKTKLIEEKLREERQINSKLKQQVKKLEKDNLECKEKYIALIEDYYNFLSKIK